MAIEKGRNYFGNMGTWSLDDPDYPTQLILHTQDESGMPSDTLAYDLGAVVRPHDNLLDIVYDRRLACDGKPCIGIHLQLQPSAMKSFNINPLQSTPAVFFMALFLAVSGQTFGQAVSLTPSPTGPDDLVTLTIDVSQSQENGLKTVLEANPDLPVYIWTWSPSGPVAGNGDWNNSNDAMQLSWQGGLVYSLQFVPSEFYSDVSSLFSNGISCLAKLKDGNPYPGFEDFGEAKTEDFNVGVLPKLCEEQMCKSSRDATGSTTSSASRTTATSTSDLTDIVDDDVYLANQGRAN